MVYVKMDRGGNYRGTKYSTGTILEVSEALRQRIVSEKQGSISTQEAYEAQQKEAQKVDYMTLNRDPLNAYAISLNIDAELVKNARNKTEVQELVKAALEKKA